MKRIALSLTSFRKFTAYLRHSIIVHTPFFVGVNLTHLSIVFVNDGHSLEWLFHDTHLTEFLIGSASETSCKQP